MVTGGLKAVSPSFSTTNALEFSCWEKISPSLHVLTNGILRWFLRKRLGQHLSWRTTILGGGAANQRRFSHGAGTLAPNGLVRLKPKKIFYRNSLFSKFCSSISINNICRSRMRSIQQETKRECVGPNSEISRS